MQLFFQEENHRNATICLKQPWKMYVIGSKLPNHKFLNVIKDQKYFLQYMVLNLKTKNYNDL